VAFAVASAFGFLFVIPEGNLRLLLPLSSSNEYKSVILSGGSRRLMREPQSKDLQLRWQLHSA
jgi:tetraacyldisaccharide-1-P 4'-kinase